jgi:hypothetical protein
MYGMTLDEAPPTAYAYLCEFVPRPIAILGNTRKRVSIIHAVTLTSMFIGFQLDGHFGIQVVMRSKTSSRRKRRWS